MYTPIDFENKPSIKTPLSAENLNYMQQGIVLAVDRSRLVYEAWQDGSLKGDKGDRGDTGLQGVRGEQGVQGEQGIQGVKGIQGEKGNDGVFDINAITPQQLAELHAKLYELNQEKTWGYQTSLVSNQSVRFKLADLNLDLQIIRTSATTLSYALYPNDSTKPSTFLIRRLSNYDLTAFEATASANFRPAAITSTGFTLDASGYLAGREYTQIQIVDSVENAWYTVFFIGDGEGKMFVDVLKRQAQGRVVI